MTTLKSTTSVKSTNKEELIKNLVNKNLAKDKSLSAACGICSAI